MSKIFIAVLISLTCISLYSLDIKTNNGKEYKEVEIIDAKPNGLDIIHSRGAAFLSFENLSENIRKKYKYDPLNAAEYEKQLKVEKEKLKKELAEKRRAAAEKKKKEAAEKALSIKERQGKIIRKVYSEGLPVKLNRKVLFNQFSGQPIFASAELLGKTDVYPAYGKYMVVKKNVYLITNNVIYLPAKLEEIETEILENEEISDKLKKSVEKLDWLIKRNIERIRDLLDITGIKVTDFYDKDGKYIGTTRTTDDLTDNQIRLIEILHLENLKIDKEIVEKGKDLFSIENRLITLTKERDILRKEIEIFKANQNKYLEYIAKKNEKEKDNKAVEIVPEDIETKLENLKTMKEKGLIPKDVYDKKVAEAVEKYLKD